MFLKCHRYPPFERFKDDFCLPSLLILTNSEDPRILPTLYQPLPLSLSVSVSLSLMCMHIHTLFLKTELTNLVLHFRQPQNRD